jgi:hypothetical protein
MPLTQVQPGMLGTPQPYNFKNRIINGAMVIDQRNAGASVTALDSVPVDRFRFEGSQTSKLTWQQNAGSVTPPVGFTNYLGATSSSAYSITSTDFFLISQRIEGYNMADLGWGTANAKTVTISFWVRSSLTGNFGGVIANNAANYNYPFTYSIPTANTWTTISVTIAGATSGTWLTTNGSGITVRFGLGVGSTYSGTAGAWTTTANIFSSTGATSVVGTNGATFYITGVQLEVGVTATGFDYRPYGTELALCQRYYYRWIPSSTNNPIGNGFAYSTTPAFIQIPFPVIMRDRPSALEQSGTASDYRLVRAGPTTINLSIVPVYSNASTANAQIVATVSSGLTTGEGITMQSNSTSGYLGWSAEL